MAALSTGVMPASRRRERDPCASRACRTGVHVGVLLMLLWRFIAFYIPRLFCLGCGPGRIDRRSSMGSVWQHTQPAYRPWAPMIVRISASKAGRLHNHNMYTMHFHCIKPFDRANVQRRASTDMPAILNTKQETLGTVHLRL